jgi:hypothetical protein
MSRAELLALAERVENALGPDAELDTLIRKVMDGRVWRNSRPPHDEHLDPVNVPRYTASLDAATTLALRHGFIATIGCIAADGLPGCLICTCTDPVREVWGLSAAGTDQLGRLARATTSAALRAAAEDLPA